MSTTIWKLNPEILCAPSPHDLEQILLTAYNSDDGTYYLDKKLLKTLKHKIATFTFCTLEKEIKANDSINFIIG